MMPVMRGDGVGASYESKIMRKSRKMRKNKANSENKKTTDRDSITLTG
jgi:hypothetical protein